MKWLLVIAFLMLAGAAWLHGRLERQQRTIRRLQHAVDSLEQVVSVRQWVDRRNFNKLISNVQYLNTHTVITHPQLKSRLDRFEKYWQLWQSE